ncbi:MAG: amidohydrolase [Deltaproteobacteria bacterium]|nr:amidohydrolase [Deltaproteobacteria bacterium]
MIIDVHSHLSPVEWSENKPVLMFDIEGYLEAQSEKGIDLTVFSNTMMGNMPVLDLKKIDKIKRFHEFAAELVSRHPENLAAFACTVPFRGDEYLEETARAIKDYGLKGVMVNSSVDGEYLDSPRAYPFYELLCELDVPMCIHPPAYPVGSEWMKQYKLIETVGRPCDTTLTLARMVLYGTLEKYPKLKVIAAHLGGAITMLSGRLDMSYGMRELSGYGDWGPEVMTKKPSEYIRMLYVDSVSFHQPALMCALETLGPDHVLFGTDFPPVYTDDPGGPVGLIKDLPLAEEDKAKICGKNAERLLCL